MGIRGKNVAGRLTPERCRPPQSCARSKGCQLNVPRNLQPEKWPVRTDLSALTGRDVQAGYFGEWPEPSAGDAVRVELEAHAVQNAAATEFRNCGLCIVGK